MQIKGSIKTSKNNLPKEDLIIEKKVDINILLNRVKIEKKNDFKKKLYFFSMLSLVIIIFSSIAISI